MSAAARPAIVFDLPVSQAPPSIGPRPFVPQRDLGRWFARALCVLFAVIGLLPVLAGALTRWGPVREWAAIETTRLLNEQLGLHANYQVRISLWPLGLELRDVTLFSSDGGAPALSAHG